MTYTGNQQPSFLPLTKERAELSKTNKLCFCIQGCAGKTVTASCLVTALLWPYLPSSYTRTGEQALKRAVRNVTTINLQLSCLKNLEVSDSPVWELSLKRMSNAMRVTANRYLFSLQNTPSCQHSSLRLRRPAATAKALHQTIRGNTTVRNCCGSGRDMHQDARLAAIWSRREFVFIAWRNGCPILFVQAVQPCLYGNAEPQLDSLQVTRSHRSHWPQVRLQNLTKQTWKCGMLDAPQAFGSQWQPNKTVQPAQSEPWCSRLSQTLRMLTKRCIWSKTISSRTSCIYLQSRPITLTKYSINIACLNLRTSPQHPPGHWSCWTRSSTCLHVDKTHTLTQPRHSGLSSQPPLPLKISHWVLRSWPERRSFYKPRNRK